MGLRQVWGLGFTLGIRYVRIPYNWKEGPFLGEEIEVYRV